MWDWVKLEQDGVKLEQDGVRLNVGWSKNTRRMEQTVSDGVNWAGWSKASHVIIATKHGFSAFSTFGFSIDYCNPNTILTNLPLIILHRLLQPKHDFWSAKTKVEIGSKTTFAIAPMPSIEIVMPINQQNKSWIPTQKIRDRLAHGYQIADVCNLVFKI